LIAVLALVEPALDGNALEAIATLPFARDALLQLLLPAPGEDSFTIADPCHATAA